MKDLHGWNVASLGTIDERLEPEQEQRHIVIAPIGTMSKRLLGINDQQCRSSSGHLMPPIVRLAFIDIPICFSDGKAQNCRKWDRKGHSFLGGIQSPDGKYIAQGAKAEGKVSIVRKPSDGSSAEETLPTQGPEIATSPVVNLSPGVR